MLNTIYLSIVCAIVVFAFINGRKGGNTPIY
jgi:hypothetical protein